MDWSTPALRVSLSTEDSEPSLSGPSEDRMGSSPECHLGTEALVPKQMTAGETVFQKDGSGATCGSSNP